MTGTEKQGKWAQDIRAQLVKDIERLLKRGGVSVDEFLAMDLPDAKIASDILAVEDHRFWIDAVAPAGADLKNLVASPRLADHGIVKADYGL